LTIKSNYAIIKEKGKGNMKNNLEIVVAELEKALLWNSEIMTTLGFKIDESEKQNDSWEYEYNKCEKTHTKLFNALVIAKKLLKEIKQELKKGE
jgi:hypothetical protein